MLFSQIQGLQPLKDTLVQAVQHNHVAHAQLFHGQQGSANLAMVLAFATYLNCEDPQPTDACGRCASCVKMAKLVHPDLHLIFPVPSAKEDIITLLPQWRKFVEQSPYQTLSEWLGFVGVKGNQQGIIPIKEAHSIISKISLKAFEGKYKILVIWQPELMNVESANALLKVLEEPPAQTIFLLACNDANRLLTTIISRTQRIYIPSFEQADTIAYLTQRHQIEEGKAQQIAFLAEGNFSKAVSLINETDHEQHEWFADWMRNCYRANLIDLVGRADAFDAMPKEKQKNILEYALQVFRELFLAQHSGQELSRLVGNEQIFVQNFAKAIPAGRVEKIVEILSEMYLHLERNVRAKVVFLDSSLQLAKLMKK
jgi:DNA polymerase III subunit delta'